MRIVVLKETDSGENRVALIPESVKKLTAQEGVEVAIEKGAGQAAGILDEEYEKAGAKLETGRDALLQSADVLAVVQPPDSGTFGKLKEGAVVFGFLRPLDEPAALQPAVEKKITTFAAELVPRTTRAQSMDALSSMATVAGYKAVLVAAGRIPRMFPMLMTAAGTIAPAQVLVLGAGVAGLQAIATAKRLGAQVSAYDVRRAAGEQVKSLGANFLAIDLGEEGEGEGGYAKELSPEALQKGKELVAKHAKKADVVITTAQIPGRKAPILMEEDAVRGMKPGAVIVDLAGSTGGNTALTKVDEEVLVDGVAILAPSNLVASVPLDASQMYSRNVTSFLGLLIEDGKLNVNFEDDIIESACVTFGGEIKNKRVAEAMAAGENAK